MPLGGAKREPVQRCAGYCSNGSLWRSNHESVEFPSKSCGGRFLWFSPQLWLER